MIIPDVYGIMNSSECIGENIANASEFRVRINAEFLNGCEFDCAGCFVKRRNVYISDDMDMLVNIISKFRDTGHTFDEIILGPTDFFAAYNSLSIINDERFIDIFKNGDVVLTLLSTLQSDISTISGLIHEFNTLFQIEGLEIEVLIPVDIKELHEKNYGYIKNLKDKIQLLNLFDAEVDYALQLNIRDLDKDFDDFNIVEITKLVKDEFNTILEFNPSFMRSGNIDKVTSTLVKWNTMLERCLNDSNKDLVTLTISNKYHAGNNERTFTFKDGHLYVTPFIYENVVSLKTDFMIEKSNSSYEIDDINLFDIKSNIEQYKYVNKTDHCEGCPHVSSCISKLVLRYMEVNNITQCLLSRKSIELYDNQ